MKRPQIDIIKYALIATAIFTLILILVYVYRFHHGLSYNHNDFADFGSYLGSSHTTGCCISYKIYQGCFSKCLKSFF